MCFHLQTHDVTVVLSTLKIRRPCAPDWSQRSDTRYMSRNAPNCKANQYKKKKHLLCTDENNKSRENNKSSKGQQQEKQFLKTDKGRGPTNITKMTKITYQASHIHQNNNSLRRTREEGPQIAKITNQASDSGKNNNSFCNICEAPFTAFFQWFVNDLPVWLPWFVIVVIFGIIVHDFRYFCHTCEAPFPALFQAQFKRRTFYEPYLIRIWTDQNWLKYACSFQTSNLIGRS